MARPTKYTEETVERILEGIRLGLTYRHACRCGGVDYVQFNRWMHRYREFRDAVGVANATAVQMERINLGAKEGDWRAAAWILERRFPDDYGSRFSDSMSDPLADTGVRRIIVERVNRAEREVES